MKSIIEIIDSLNGLNSEIIKKDNLLNSYKKMYNLVNKFINDEQFVKSDSYFIFKNNYLNDLTKLMSTIENVPLESQLVIQVNRPIYNKHKDNINNDEVGTEKGKEEGNKRNNIEINTKIVKVNSFDPYNSRSSNRIPKINKKFDNHKEEYYSLDLNDNKYLFNPTNNKIYDMKEYCIGYIENNKVYINGELVYELESISSFDDLRKLNNYRKLNSEHIIMNI